MQTQENNTSANSSPWNYDGEIGGDMFDIRDVIARVEELESEQEQYIEAHREQEAASDSFVWSETDEGKELAFLAEFLEEVKGNGGDEQWRGDWYPVGFIAESYFTEYTKELLADCGDIPRDVPHYIEIDWDKTADNIRVDYSEVEFNGDTYLYR